ncbi:MAG: FeoA family protein [Egibacteraceae bacterium]
MRYLGELGIRPGADITVEDRGPFDGPLWIRVGGQRHVLSSTVVPPGGGRS